MPGILDVYLASPPPVDHSVDPVVDLDAFGCLLAHEADITLDEAVALVFSAPVVLQHLADTLLFLFLRPAVARAPHRDAEGAFQGRDNLAHRFAAFRIRHPLVRGRRPSDYESAVFELLFLVRERKRQPVAAEIRRLEPRLGVTVPVRRRRFRARIMAYTRNWPAQADERLRIFSRSDLQVKRRIDNYPPVLDDAS